MKHVSLSLALVATLSGSAPVFAQAQTVSTPALSVNVEFKQSGFDRFVPQPANNTRLDFTVWDEMLKEMVYYTGPSLRQRASRPEPTVGSRIVFGHTSPYRLEGNKVIFERMNDEFESIIADYISDLVGIGNRIDISKLPRNEQLAYWFNLHNALVVQGIADNYPVDEPYRINSSNGLSFHDSPRVTIEGVTLSLRNIREDIVYRNWSDPLVIYGFFHGDIGSPSIQRKAYTADTVRETLRFSGQEFANSLRGFIVQGGKPSISRHYQDAAPYFFKNFDVDVRTHLSTVMNPDVREEMENAAKPVKIASYETDIADLSKGDSNRSSPYPVETVSSLGSRFGGQDVLLRAIREQTEKFRRIRKNGMFGTVTIEDVETVDPSDISNQDFGIIGIGSIADEVDASETGE